MCLPKKICLSMPISGHDTKVWKTSAGALHNKQIHSELYLQPMELLNTINQAHLSPNCLQLFADIIYAKGAPLDNRWGFIDGTARLCCSPGINQRIVYNGHKRVHSIKFQSVGTLDYVLNYSNMPVVKITTFFVCMGI